MADTLSGIGEYYSQYKKTDSTSEKLSGALNSTDYSKATDEELMNVCKQFESYFVEQVIKSMEKMIPKDKDSETSKYLDYFGDVFTQELAGAVTEQSNLGLAQTLYELMKRNYSNT